MTNQKYYVGPTLLCYLGTYIVSPCQQDVKETAYKKLVRPILEYASHVWDPHWIVVQEELEKVQNSAASLWLETTTLKLKVWLAFLNN